MNPYMKKSPQAHFHAYMLDFPLRLVAGRRSLPDFCGDPLHTSAGGLRPPNPPAQVCFFLPPFFLPFFPLSSAVEGVAVSPLALFRAGLLCQVPLSGPNEGVLDADVPFPIDKLLLSLPLLSSFSYSPPSPSFSSPSPFSPLPPPSFSLLGS